ncbi:MAG TPA: aspartate aminotransferase family protein, partial [Candidatus Eremiobacteraceae bacterium]|nr:aspartate aminotransferase family protein [Candidatus Eremiobacteraceae bacterium]
MATVSEGRNASRKARYLMECQRTYYREPLTLVSGRGAYVTDDAGRNYLDFFAGIAVLLVGHSHPKVNAAVHEQIDALTHTSTLYLTEPMLDLAERIVESAPAGLDKVFFGNSGTEANEVAAVLARRFTGAKDFIALDDAYHGRSAWTVGVSGLSAWRNFGAEPEHVAFAPNAYCYRCPLQLTYPSCGIACAKAIEDVIATRTSGNVAAFYAETIQGVGGIITPPPEYYELVKEILDRHGILFIADEVQTAWGRLGRSMFGISDWGVTPDIVTSAKGLGNGYPISIVVARREVADAYKGPHINTFGGNPVSARAALATLDVVEEEGLAANAKRMGARLMQGLEALSIQHTSIGEVRGRGLMIGVELVRDRATKEPASAAAEAVVDGCREAGLLVGRGGDHANVIRIQPPLIITSTQVDDALTMFDTALAAA